MNFDSAKFWAVVLLVGCTSRNLDLDESEAETEEALNVAGKWDCYSRPEPERSSPQEPPMAVSHALRVADYTHPGEPPVDVYVRACPIGDPSCIAPVSLNGSEIFATSAGQFDLPFGFDGYLELQASGYTAMTYYFGGPLVGMPPNAAAGGSTAEDPWITSGSEISMLRVDDYERLLSSWSVSVDPGRGMLMFHVLDCSNDPATDVTLALEAESDVVPWISVGGVPVAHEHPVATDADGFAGFANVAPGTIVAESVVSCSVSDDGTTPAPRFRLSSIGAGAGVVASEPCSSGAAETVHSRSAFRVRPGWVTMTELRSHYSYRE